MPSAKLAPTRLRHVLNRFSYGVSPTLVEQAQETGGATAWFEQQLNPRAVADDRVAAMKGWFPYLWHSPGELWDIHESGEYYGWEMMTDLARWTIMRRTYSKRQLHEVMSDFWSNLLHVPGWTDMAWPHRVAYDKTIRQHALGRFEDMLIAAVLHPAMGCYLDNAISTKDSVNENLGRELLELHSVGVEAGYGEQDVLNSAYLLTGYRVDMWDTWNAFYAKRDHWVGQVQVLGFSAANSKPDGRSVTLRYLRYLANHPATARRIARRLCQRFASDHPSDALVTAVATAFTTSGTDVKATLRAMFAHPDFDASVDDKVRTPAEDAIACYRLLGAQASRPNNDNDFARAVVWQLQPMGQSPFDWPGPDGFPEVGSAWASVGRVLASLDLHLTLAGGWWPSQAVTYPSTKDRLPTMPARFDDIVDHVSRKLLQRRATVELQQAARQRVDASAAQVFDSARDFGEWRLTLLMATVLDSPAHAAR